MTPLPTLPSDRQLVGAVRGGSDAAWNELMGRHASPVRAMLRSRRERKALEARLVELRGQIEHHDDSFEGDPAVRAFRPRALAAISGGTYGPQTSGVAESDAEPSPFDVPDDEILATAFARLPEPWQTVLWHSHVEHLTAAEISPLVGRTTNDVVELINTAERGLGDAFLLEYIAVGPLPQQCERVVSMLGGHVRRTISLTDQRLVDRHLAGEAPATEAPPMADAAGLTTDPSSFAPPLARAHTVEDSQRLLDIVGALDRHLPPAIAPGVTGLTVEEHRHALGTSNRSFGSAALEASRSTRFRRVAVVVAAAAVVIALAGAVFLLRQASGDDDVSGHGDHVTTEQISVSTSTPMI